MIATTIIERRFTGDGMTVSFPADIEGIPDAPVGAAHLALSVLDAGGEATPLVYGADFSYAAVVVNGFSKSIVATLSVPLPAGKTLVVRRTTPVVSISSYPDDKTPPRQVERDFDNAIKIMQETNARVEDVESGIPPIHADISSLHAADAQLARGIAAEAGARADADARLARDIAAEAAARAAANAALLAEVDDALELKADKSALEDLEAVVDGKASTATATTSSPGLMSDTDKIKLDGIGIATTDRAGLVKPDGISVTVDDDGTLHAAGGGGGGTSDHRALSNRDAPEQHRDTSIIRGAGPKTVNEAVTDLEDGAAATATALAGIDGELASVKSELTGKANSAHSHVITDTAGLTEALSGIAELAEALADKAPLESPNFSGEPTGPTPPTADDSDRLATTAHVKAVVGGIDVSDKAPLPITTTNEIGNWRLIYFANVTSFALPSGGTWAYFLTAANSAQAVTHSFSRAGVAAGGTVVTGTLNTGYGSGFMWRIA